MCFKYEMMQVMQWTEGKRPLGIPRRRWKNNIKMDFKEVEWGGMDWIDLAH